MEGCFRCFFWGILYVVKASCRWRPLGSNLSQNNPHPGKDLQINQMGKIIIANIHTYMTSSNWVFYVRAHIAAIDLNSPTCIVILYSSTFIIFTSVTGHLSQDSKCTSWKYKHPRARVCVKCTVCHVQMHCVCVGVTIKSVKQADFTF